MAAQQATAMFAQLGIPVAALKTEGPSTCMTFLGILVDSTARQLRLPLD